jgi:hypothetical protein
MVAAPLMLLASASAGSELFVLLWHVVCMRTKYPLKVVETAGGGSMFFAHGG